MPTTSANSTNNRKRLEIAFRRWIREESPSKFFSRMLGEESRSRYQAKLLNAEIDHVVPLSMFDLTNERQIRLAWCLDNVRPSEHQDNKVKGASIESAYLHLFVAIPSSQEDYSALVAMVEPDFFRLHPNIVVARGE